MEKYRSNQYFITNTREDVREMNRLRNKVAIVSGGASGIGEGTVRLFAQEGAQVVVADINETLGRKVAEEVRQAGGDATFIRLDVSREEEWDSAIRQMLERYGKLNVLINNAGISLATMWRTTRWRNGTGSFPSTPPASTWA
jgi:NAD(P)-dependent dehydrogenase (short-subunit alcohol dehydrogenase family)